MRRRFMRTTLVGVGWGGGLRRSQNIIYPSGFSMGFIKIHKVHHDPSRPIGIDQDTTAINLGIWEMAMTLALLRKDRQTDKQG